MSGIILLVVEEGFDDMSLLTCQVILEENGNDIIICSKEAGAVKGEESSVMTVDLSEAITQNINYDAIIVLGGASTGKWELLSSTLVKFENESKLIGAISNGIEQLKHAGIDRNLSSSAEITIDRKVISLSDPTEVEKFVENFIALFQ